ncbi:MAG: response regulator, partial [Coleofasciculaceae cyanobacterium SM2_3_26]|nr:response regulator [Coleofasciculaceae cyanobacterium SM2_3_26]
MTSDRPTPSKGNLMIVDDMPVNLRLLSELLSRNGYRVRSVRTGQTALTAIEAQPPDLILLDVMMPEMDGYEVCDHLKADHRLRHIPVIFLSALDDVSGKVKAFKVGGADYITKPFQVEEVLARVEHQMTIQRLQRELIEKISTRRIESNLEQLVRRKTQLLIDQEKTALIGRLTQGMVHNIGNPLQAVLFCCELINKELEAPACNRKALLEYIQDAKTAIKQVQQIADNLLVKSARDR